MAVYFLPKSRLKPFLARTDLPEDVLTIDVSIKAGDDWNMLAPGFNHGDIPVPGMAGKTARTVEGIWEGLKRFTFEGEDLAMLDAEKPKKRRLTEGTGDTLGHVFEGKTLRDEVEARRRIFIPAYTWMVRNCPQARAKFDQLVDLSRKNTLHLHDGGENGNVHDARPYAYAALLTELVKEARKEKAALAESAR